MLNGPKSYLKEKCLLAGSILWNRIRFMTMTQQIMSTNGCSMLTQETVDDGVAMVDTS